MIGRFLSRLVVRVGLLALLGVAALSQGWLGAAAAWVIFAYLLWRAAPAVGRDLRRVWFLGKKISNSQARF